MEKDELLQRIVLDPRVMVGKPCVRGTRLSVDFILRLLAQGIAAEEILEEYQGLTRDDIAACLLFASEALGSSAFVPVASAPA